jgi:acetolactate synthase-1/2/3 large subunit
MTTRHEQGAAFMADVYGRLTGRPGVCFSTLGPGATNLLTGVADANMDHAPLVALTGQAGLDRMHKESHQFIDIMAMFKTVTKWQAQITTPSIIAEAIRKAFKVSQPRSPVRPTLNYRKMSSRRASVSLTSMHHFAYSFLMFLNR